MIAFLKLLAAAAVIAVAYWATGLPFGMKKQRGKEKKSSYTRFLSKEDDD